MARATYLCQIGCLGECRHKIPCMVFRSDEDHPHPPKHIGWDGQMLHEWVGKATGKCTISSPPEDD